jgi:hypothetical protein
MILPGFITTATDFVRQASLVISCGVKVLVG